MKIKLVVQGVRCQGVSSTAALEAFLARAVARLAGVSVDAVRVVVISPCGRTAAALRRSLEADALQANVTIDASDAGQAQELASSVDRSMQDGSMTSVLKSTAASENSLTGQWGTVFEGSIASGEVTASTENDEQNGNSASVKDTPESLPPSSIIGIAAAATAGTLFIAFVVWKAYSSRQVKPVAQDARSDDTLSGSHLAGRTLDDAEGEEVTMTNPVKRVVFPPRS